MCCLCSSTSGLGPFVHQILILRKKILIFLFCVNECTDDKVINFQVVVHKQWELCPCVEISNYIFKYERVLYICKWYFTHRTCSENLLLSVKNSSYVMSNYWLDQYLSFNVDRCKSLGPGCVSSCTFVCMINLPTDVSSLLCDVSFKDLLRSLYCGFLCYSWVKSS